MVLHKKISFCSFKTLIFLVIYLIVFCSLLFIYLVYQQVHLPADDSSNNQEIAEMRQYPFEWLKNTFANIPPTSVGSINIKSYPYIINEPHKCKDQSPFLILLISTVAREAENRAAIRTTFGKETLKNGISIMCLFMLGTDRTVDHDIIVEESEKFHDIIQKGFQDTYKNLTIKTMMGIDWVSTYCPKANYVMKTDSDMFVNTEYLVDLLGLEMPPKQNYFTGYLMQNHQPHRNKDSKWHMPHSLYPDNFYPNFCSGTGYVFSGDVAPKILRASFKVKYVYLEDVFVGICLDREGIQITPPGNYLFHNYHVSFDPCVYHNLITSHYISPSDLIIYWKIVQEHKESCSKNGRR